IKIVGSEPQTVAPLGVRPGVVRTEPRDVATEGRAADHPRRVIDDPAMPAPAGCVGDVVPLLFLKRPEGSEFVRARARQAAGLEPGGDLGSAHSPRVNRDTGEVTVEELRRHAAGAGGCDS